MKTPLTVKWIIGLSIFRIVIAVFLVAGTAHVLFNRPGSGFFKGFGDVISEHLALNDSDPAYALGHLMGTLLIPFILIILEIVFIRSKKRVGFWICIALDFLFTLSSISLPVMPIILLILGLNKSTTLYFKGESEEQPSTDILDRDLR